jgi:uncharacterized lipoprotein YmbA
VGLPSASVFRISIFTGAALALFICLSLTGCGFLKPARSTARNFVLTPMIPESAVAETSNSLAIGVGQVKIPTYLFDSSLAVRTGTNEVKYLSSVLWAERLDNGLQRVLAANFATLLPTDQVRMSAWRNEDVWAEVYVTVERFDVDTAGQGVLRARWRILSPGGEKTLKAGTSHLSHQGPPPATDPSGAVGTLSELVGDLSRELAQAVKEVATVPVSLPVVK